MDFEREVPPFHLAVFLGAHVAPLIGPNPVTPSYTRLEFGVGAPWTASVVAELAVHQAADRWAHAASTVVAGDTFLSNFGVSLRRELTTGPLRVYPNATLGVSYGVTPYFGDQPALRRELQASDCQCEPEQVGPWAQLGADVGYPVGTVTLLVGVEVGYGLFVLGPVGTLHVGIDAAF